MFWNIFCNLCTQKGISANKAAKELNISSGSITNWKNGTIPQNAKLKKIAEYFGVTIEYLLGKENAESNKNTNEEALLLSAYLKADESIKKSVRKLLDIEEPTNRAIDSDPASELGTDVKNAFTKTTT